MICHLATSVPFFLSPVPQHTRLFFYSAAAKYSRNSKHVVTTCIHLSGIFSECGIHNLKREKQLVHYQHDFVVCTMRAVVFFFYYIFSSCRSLTQTMLVYQKISIVSSILQWKRYVHSFRISQFLLPSTILRAL